MKRLTPRGLTVDFDSLSAIPRLLALSSVIASLCCSTAVLAQTSSTQEVDTITLGYLGIERPAEIEPLSVLDPVIDDEGVQGARLAINDNNATGQFLGQEFVLVESIVAEQEEVLAGLETLIEQGADWIISGLPDAALQQVLDLPDTGRSCGLQYPRPGENALRSETCRANMFHTTPQPDAC